MATTNFEIPKGAGYVEVASAVSTGLLSVPVPTQFATSDTTPAEGIKGHGINSTTPRRYSLVGNSKLYVLSSNAFNFTVSIDED